MRDRDRLTIALRELPQRVTAPVGAPPRGDMHPHRAEGAPRGDPDEVRERNADERLRADTAETVQHALHAHARIHHHRHRADPEQCEDHREQIRLRPDHHNRLDALADSDIGECPRIGVDPLAELAKGQRLEVRSVRRAGPMADGRQFRVLLELPRQLHVRIIEYRAHTAPSTR